MPFHSVILFLRECHFLLLFRVSFWAEWFRNSLWHATYTSSDCHLLFETECFFGSYVMKTVTITPTTSTKQMTTTQGQQQKSRSLKKKNWMKKKLENKPECWAMSEISDVYFSLCKNGKFAKNWEKWNIREYRAKVGKSGKLYRWLCGIRRYATEWMRQRRSRKHGKKITLK